MHGTDHLGVSEAVFGELDSLAVPLVSRFLSNTTGLATDGGTSNTRFIYNTVSGVLSFDSNGTGADHFRTIAILVGHPVLDVSDFLLM